MNESVGFQAFSELESQLWNQAVLSMNAIFASSYLFLAV